MKTPNIERFCKETGLNFKPKGEAGFGRPCAGIEDAKTECWLDYEGHDAANTKSPKDAYHKGPYLCVLAHNDDYDAAIEQLEGWVGEIINAGYQMGKKDEVNTIHALLSGGKATVQVLLNS